MGSPPPRFRFRLQTLAYIVAVIGASIGAWGAIGLVVAPIVLAGWASVFIWPQVRRELFDAWKFWIAESWKIWVLGLVFFFLYGLFIPQIGSRGMPLSAVCDYHMHRIGMALDQYQKTYDRLPPPFVADAEGRPMYSWRVLILPQLSEQDLYSKFNLAEPWDSPTNATLKTQIPDVYQCPFHRSAAVGMCHYFVISGDGAIFDGSKGAANLGDIPDGADSTILLVESDQPVFWSQPLDMTPEDFLKPFRDGDSSTQFVHERDTFLTHGKYLLAMKADLQVVILSPDSDFERLQAMVTRAGGEHFEGLDNEVVMKFNSGKLVSLVIFAVLVVLPVFRLPAFKWSEWLARRPAD